MDEIIEAANPSLFNNAGDRWGEFWNLAIGHIESLRSSDAGVKLIDCGAGCLQTPEALRFFSSQDSVVLFSGNPEALFRRAKESRPFWRQKTKEEYIASEFSDLRQKFYATASHVIDTTILSSQGTENEFLRVLSGNVPSI